MGNTVSSGRVIKRSLKNVANLKVRQVGIKVGIVGLRSERRESWERRKRALSVTPHTFFQSCLACGLLSLVLWDQSGSLVAGSAAAKVNSPHRRSPGGTKDAVTLGLAGLPLALVESSEASPWMSSFGASLERSDDSDKYLGLRIAFLQVFTHLAFFRGPLRGLSSAALRPQAPDH
jgi:hypothetical protein